MIKPFPLLTILWCSSPSVALAQVGLDFPQALDRIQEVDQERASQSLQIDSERANLQHEKRVHLPEVNLGFQQAWKSEEERTNVLRRRDPAFFAEARVKLYSFGRDQAYSDALNATDRSLDWKKNLMNLEAEARAAKLILAALSLHFQSLVIDERRHSRQVFRDNVQTYFNAGRLPKDEFDRLNIDMTTLDFELDQTLVSKKILEEKLSTYLKDARLQQQWPLATPEKLKDRVEQTLKSQTAARNPALALLEEELQSSRSRYLMSSRTLLPTLNLQADTARSMNGPDNGWDISIALSLNFPLISKEHSRFQVEASYKQVLAVEAQLASVEQSLTQRLTANREDLQLEWTQKNQRRALLDKAVDIQKQSRRRFEVGLLKYNELAVDEQRVHDLMLEDIRSSERLHLLLVEHCHLRGTPWSACSP